MNVVVCFSFVLGSDSKGISNEHQYKDHYDMSILPWHKMTTTKHKINDYVTTNNVPWLKRKSV